MKILFAMMISAGLLSSVSALPRTSESKVKMGSLPPAVQQAVKEQSQGAKLVGLAKEVEDGKTLYEAELKVNWSRQGCYVRHRWKGRERRGRGDACKFARACKSGDSEGRGKREAYETGIRTGEGDHVLRSCT